MRQSTWACLLAAMLVGSGATSCRGARRLAADAAGDSIPCRSGGTVVTARIDSLGIRARRAGDRGDLTVLHAVSDTIDSLERLAGRPCPSDSSHAVR